MSEAPTFDLGGPLEAWIARSGRVLREDRQHDPGCVCFEVEMDGRQAFLKQARTARAARGLLQAAQVDRRQRYPSVRHLLGAWRAQAATLPPALPQPH
ncbi:MAG: hypothetical protein ACYCW6_30610 [Candidatus Xenobia bacterium]